MCYLDSSVALRILFRETNPLREWAKIRIPFSSRIFALECWRTFDRWKIREKTTPYEETAAKNHELIQTLSSVSLLPLTEIVLSRAEQPCPVPLSSLDGIHLATALLWRETHGDDFLFATHDAELALAAKAHGFEVIGI